MDVAESCFYPQLHADRPTRHSNTGCNTLGLIITAYRRMPCKVSTFAENIHTTWCLAKILSPWIIDLFLCHAPPLSWMGHKRVALAALLPLALKHCLVCPQLPRVVYRNLHQNRGATATPSCLGKPVVLDRLCHGWQIHQVKNGYRFNGDDILLAREACRVGKIGQKRLLDLGSGAW